MSRSLRAPRPNPAVLPGESLRRYRERCREWSILLQPTGAIETFLVEDAVNAAWRLERARRAESAALSRAVRGAAERDRHIQAENVESLASGLAEEPRRVARRLRLTAAGCRWVLEQLAALREILVVRGWLEPSERDHLLHLLGTAADELFHDPVVYDICEACLASGATLGTDPADLILLLGLEPPEQPVERWEFQRRVEDLQERVTKADPAQARQTLVSLIASEESQLSVRYGRLHQKESLDRADAILLASFETSGESQSRLRFEEANRRAIRGAVFDLQKLRDLRRNRLESSEFVAPLRCTGDGRLLRGPRVAADRIRPGLPEALDPAADPEPTSATLAHLPLPGSNATRANEPVFDTRPRSLPVHFRGLVGRPRPDASHGFRERTISGVPSFEEFMQQNLERFGPVPVPPALRNPDAFHGLAPMPRRQAPLPGDPLP
ncbi:MAG: hypothetical protein U0794_06775 [Isosphaeraceae bacterium]